MAESAALVPIPFYPPVRSGTGTLFTFSESSNGPELLKQPVRTTTPEPDDGLIYSGGGRLVADLWLGTRVDIYV